MINKIDSELLKRIKLVAKKESAEENKVLNEVIERGLNTRNRIPDDLILNKYMVLILKEG
ncbi:MAG: hypothetical protein LBV42_00625 [Methanobrevibacter sp.]|jgi:hypothetical protein|nr:hypothetical protein [Methanobrevibacter sp.]